jgi:hypothetical protein
MLHCGRGVLLARCYKQSPRFVKASNLLGVGSSKLNKREFPSQVFWL